MGTYSYDKKQLTRVCADIKRNSLIRVKKDVNFHISKTRIYSEIARKLGLKSDRTLWRSTYLYREYLDNWYSQFEVELSNISKEQSNPSPQFIDNISTNDDHMNILKSQIQYYKSKVKELEKVINTLRIENESLRLSKINRFGFIDDVDILNESLDAIELETLYQLVTQLDSTKS